jgi:glycosyltransferase involved in cell wall biosynthesis
MTHWYFDLTKSGSSRVHSGLNRVSQRLYAEAKASGQTVSAAAWSPRHHCFLNLESSTPLPRDPSATFFTSEVFAGEDRPGFATWLKSWPGRSIALCHDLIPLQFPEFTWPHSVRRHPFYLKQLLSFSQVFCVSAEVAETLSTYWQVFDSNKSKLPPLSVLTPGADRQPGRLPRAGKVPSTKVPLILTLGILEPRKDPLLALTALRQLRSEGVSFAWHHVGRINPHFGKPILKELKQAQRQGLNFTWHRQIDDTAMDALWQQAHLFLFPSRVEGFGLPVIESLWEGVPVISSPVPSTKVVVPGSSLNVLADRNPISLARTIRETLIDRPIPSPDQQRRLPTWKQAWEVLSQL